ncbi:UDP-3-O-acyl-N-acetylglucosamine deacetylase, partial [Klebsiella pneumoniae]|uniref:UDP-3-O-acyl-N-acetylglucosamine deacetylase n=1 Tax=Klebsiella pneumoniae TaxID=573 RepID=UPI00163DAABE
DGVSDTTLATTIGCNGTRISTIEHLMSALFGMGVDNAVVEVDAPELPIMDGSALPFVDLLKSVGTRAQGRCKKILVVEKPVSVEDGYGSATF